jgi:hypothetical protein
MAIEIRTAEEIRTSAVADDLRGVSEEDIFRGPLRRVGRLPVVIEIETTDGRNFAARGVDKDRLLTTHPWGGKTAEEAISRLMAHPRRMF